MAFACWSSCALPAGPLFSSKCRSRKERQVQQRDFLEGKTTKAKRSQSPALVVFGTLRMLVPCEKSQFLLLPVDLSVGAGDSLANGQERPAVSSSQITWQFSIINSTSTFTCTHQSLAVNPGACKRARQPFPLLSLASAQKAVGVGLMFQAASPP